jgi:uncharacterized phage protein (TIGR01671 family)
MCYVEHLDFTVGGINACPYGKGLEHCILDGWYNFVLSQYTGLKDKHGKEIYEGDISKYIETRYCDEQEETAIVTFNEGAFYPLPVDHIEEHDGYYSILRNDYEIIGNIYENPNLIEINGL